MTTTVEKLHDQEIIEYVSSHHQQIGLDVEQAIIRGVKILGYQSRNGRTYSETAIRTASHLYEGVKVNVNHPKGDPTKPRDYQERIGTLRAVKIREGDGLYGDLHYNPQHPIAAQLQWDAKNSPDSVGLSHNVMARTRRNSAGKMVVETILKVNSVDLVADPATTSGLFEADQNNSDPSVNEPLDEQSTTQPTAEKTKPQTKVIPTESTEIESAATNQKLHLENQQLRDQLSELQQRLDEATKKHQLQQQIDAAELPDYLVTEIFLAQLITAEGDAVDRLIEDRRRIAKCCRPLTQSPSSTSQQEAECSMNQTQTLGPSHRVQRWRGEQPVKL